MPAQLTDRDVLTAWLARLKYVVVRDLESPQTVPLANGRRLRGVFLTETIVLGRDRKLYLLVDGVARAAEPDAVLRRASLAELQHGYERAVMANRRERARRSRPGAA